VTGVPAGWEAVPVGELGDWRGGGTPSKANPEYWLGEIPWVSAKDMKVYSLRDTQDHITQQAVEESSTTVVGAGTVLLVARSGILKHTLPVAVTQVPAAINQDLKALTVGPGILPDYVAWAFRSLSQSILQSYTKSGTTVQSIEFERFKQFRVPIAPLVEQERIVAAIEEQFSRLDAAVDSMNRARARIGVLQRSLLNNLTHGGEDGNHLPRGWAWSTIGALKRSSFYGPRFSSDLYGSEGPYVVRTSDISEWGGLDVSRAPRIGPDDATYAKYKLERGDLLVTRTGSIGTLAIYDEDIPAIPGAYLIQFRFDTAKVDPWFAFYCLKSPVCYAQLLSGAAGVGRPNINAHAVDRIRIPVPPLTEQEQIVTKVREALSVFEHLDFEVSRLSTRGAGLRASVLGAAFSGGLTAETHPSHSTPKSKDKAGI
jgi:type I restriction enzyme S subunit